MTARIVLFPHCGGYGWYRSVARVVVRVAVGQKASSLAGRSRAFPKNSVVQGHDMPDGLEAPRADDESGVEQNIKRLGGLLDRVRRNNQILVVLVFSRIGISKYVL